ncbi:helix-turn-helix transcriptional regulator [uncultured Paraglaciecola sp.]|jgi:putative transcriptional regulator|uniref:helix-turn-helix transcriptional regulator n=1 Tax=uncultured Paraglaciecola sp. TaxID=1765024 RepID=UPI0025F82337|nr:helix-turn-helix transcriptional regulator [uncultured Paraglaciecola sp.]
MENLKLGNKLKYFRMEQKLTQAELGELVGVTRKTINTVENNVFVPSTLLAFKLAKALNSDVETVFYLYK